MLQLTSGLARKALCIRTYILGKIVMSCPIQVFDGAVQVFEEKENTFIIEVCTVHSPGARFAGLHVCCGCLFLKRLLVCVWP